jgi:foldase protein PrsA
MQFLISAEWIQQEADARDIEVSDEEVQKQFEDQKNQSFPNEKDYQQFLKTSGQTEEDLLFRVKLDVLSNKVREAIIEGKGDVSDEDIENYYNENKERFAQPERRDLSVVLTKTEARANEAKQALESGQSFKDVAKEFSIDEASKAQGGKLPAVAKGQQEKAFDDAIFAAEKGELTGPVKTQFGWYVFEVDKVTPASQQSLEDAKETIRNLLKSQNEQEALDSFIEDFRNKYKDETQCADDYIVEDCDNADDEQTATGPASGGSPQVAPQGGAPQGQPVPVPQGGVPQGAPPQGAPPQGQPVPVPQG